MGYTPQTSPSHLVEMGYPRFIVQFINNNKIMLRLVSKTTCNRKNGSTFFIHKFEFSDGSKNSLGLYKKGKRLNFPSEEDFSDEARELLEEGLDLSWDQLNEEYSIVEKKEQLPDEKGEIVKQELDEDTGETYEVRYREIKVLWMYDK